MSDLTIRRARVADAEVMVEYMRALVEERMDTVSVRDAPSLEDEREFVLRAQMSERALILLAFEGETMVGLLDLWGRDRPDVRHVGYFGMSVAAPARGRGIGRRLLSAAIEEAREWPGFCRIELEVTPWNAPARALYERLGFALEARKVKAINLRGEPEDMLLMALTW